MALKLIVLLLFGLVVSRACDLDWILEEIYDDSESEENASSEKPEQAQNYTKPETSGSGSNSPNLAKPSDTSSASNNSPPSGSSSPGNPPASNNSSPSNNSSAPNARAEEETSNRKHHRRSTHRRRRMFRKVPSKIRTDDKAYINEGRSFNSEADQFSILSTSDLFPERYVAKAKNRLNKNIDVEDEQSQTEFLLAARDFFSAKPSEKKNAEFRSLAVQNSDEDSSSEETERNAEKSQLRLSINKQYKSEIPDVINDDLPFSETEDIGEPSPSVTARDLIHHENTLLPKKLTEIVSDLSLKKNVKEQKKSEVDALAELLLASMIMRSINKNAYSPQVSYTEKNKNDDVYHNDFVLNEERINNDSGQSIHISVPKSFFTEVKQDSSLLRKRKRPVLATTDMRHGSHKPTENVHGEGLGPSSTKIFIYNNNPIRNILLSETSSKEHASNENHGSTSGNPDPVLHEQIRHKPIRPLDSSDTQRLAEEPQSSPIKTLNLNHVNHFKESILRESLQINPPTHSEGLNVQEQTYRLTTENSTIYNKLHLENAHQPEKSGTPEQGSSVPEEFLIQELPSPNKMHNFHQNPYVTKTNQERLQPQPLINTKVQEVHPKIPPTNGNLYVLLEGKQSSAQNIEQPHNTGQVHEPFQVDPSKLGDIYLQAQSYPIRYPINNPQNYHQYQSAYISTEQRIEHPQEGKMYLNVGNSESDHKTYEPSSVPRQPTGSEESHINREYQELPLADFTNNFKGHNFEDYKNSAHAQGHHQEPLNSNGHNISTVESSTTSVKRGLVNVV